MKILIIDSNATNQARYAERLNSFPAQDVETLDLHIMLLDPSKYEEHVEVMDLVVLGSGLGEKALSIARDIKEKFSSKNIIIFVNRENYKGQLLRQAHYIGIRRVMFDMNEDLEFLQELYAIDADFRRQGKLNYGKVTVVTSPKGGAGATTFVAALGEISSDKKEKTLIWDMDFISQDLSRALALFNGNEGNYVGWMDDYNLLTLKSFTEQTISVDDTVDLLSPPENQEICHDLCYHPEGIAVMQKALELARYRYKNIVIDLADLNNPVSEALLKLCDQIVIMTGECALSVTACSLYLEKAKGFLENLDKVKILNAGDRHTIEDLRESFAELKLNNQAWLPTLPNDSYAWMWPGSGNTLYSAGELTTKGVLTEIAEALEVVPFSDKSEFHTVSSGKVVGMPFFKSMRKEISYNRPSKKQEVSEEKEEKTAAELKFHSSAAQA